ncbi:hypothetical protein [Achromobacter dolens]|uniref:hypothetical protein n=1 Tax=Achromobacter dolens TaxID=1287738 RepID=UPI0031E0E2EA
MEHLKNHRGINADEIRNLALEEAAQAAYNALFPTNDRSDWTELAESAAYHAKYACQCIRALKTQADKDGPWCCERGEAQGVKVCQECAEISAGYQASMRGDKDGGQQRAGDDLIRALGECRDAFPTPDIAGSRLDLLWQEAMSDPTAVPAYVKACAAHAALSAPQAEQGERDA